MRIRGIVTCAIAGVGMLLGATSAWATPTSGDLFYTRFSGAPNVKKVSYAFDGVTTFTLGAPVSIGTTNGADGIAGNPQNSDLLIVGGQGPRVNSISKSTGTPSTTASPVNAFHLEVPDANTVLAAGIPGGLARHPIAASGAIGAGTVISLSGSNTTLTQVITAPGADFYTSSGPAGFGTFGTLAYNTGPNMASTATSAVTTAILTGLPAAHGGAYDPFSNTIILFGDNHITQLDLAGAILADIDFATLPFGGQSFDQGTVDGMGHVFAASNNGNLAFIDYSALSAGGLIDGVGSFLDVQFLDSALDDIAPLVGAGGTGPGPGGTPGIPEPLSATLGLMGLGVLGMATRRRAA